MKSYRNEIAHTLRRRGKLVLPDSWRLGYIQAVRIIPATAKTFTPEYLQDFAAMAGIECILIDKNRQLQ